MTTRFMLTMSQESYRRAGEVFAFCLLIATISGDQAAYGQDMVAEANLTPRPAHEKDEGGRMKDEESRLFILHPLSFILMDRGPVSVLSFRIHAEF